jgi:hypothetical protein
VLALDADAVTRVPLVVGAPAKVSDDISMTVTDYAARTIAESRPFIVPPSQRDSDVQRMASMIQVRVPGARDDSPIWLEYHEVPFETPGDTLVRYPYDPTIVEMQDGSLIELMFSRQRMELPSPVVLADFIITPHLGGFTGQTSTIRNWTSVVRFASPDSTLPEENWSEGVAVSVNEPVEHNGFWFFQASWDPPVQSGEFQSAGLNYTVLGVGNRNGVLVQLAGCIIAVLGMIHAFYLKPIIKRRRSQSVNAQVQNQRIGVTPTDGVSIVESNGFVPQERAEITMPRVENER